MHLSALDTGVVLVATANRRKCPLSVEIRLNILELVHRRSPCHSAAKVLRLPHTQGCTELPSEILQPCG